MARVSVHYASFEQDGIWATTLGLVVRQRKHDPLYIHTGQIARMEIATVQNINCIGGPLGWGVVGSTFTGPLGAIKHILLGGSLRQTTFVLETHDGKQIIGDIDGKIFESLLRHKQIADELCALIDPLAAAMGAENSSYFDEEMERKASRMLSEADYRAWKERTGEIDEIYRWIETTGYKLPPEARPAQERIVPEWQKKNPEVRIIKPE